MIHRLLSLFFSVFLSLGLWAQTEECRLKLDELEPIIARFNPYFGDHEWDPKSRIEMARMDQNRLLIITQDGCKRHHTQFTILVDPSIVQNQDEFWVREVSSMLHKVYFGRTEYEYFAREFEQTFKAKVSTFGVNNRFNFPLGTRNFICELLYDHTKGARISIEMISYIFKEEVMLRPKGIPREEDDGWKRN